MNRKRILVVEDSAPVRNILEKFLAENGYAVVTASNGEEAMGRMGSGPFSVILTDLEMPVMGGSELIDRLGERGIQGEIIVITSHDSPELIVEIMKKGVADYLIKPVQKSKLLMKVARAFTVSELKAHKALAEKEKLIRLEHQLEWYRWLERNADAKVTKVDFFNNLQRSLYQGAGFGTLVTLSNMIITTAEYREGNYLIAGGLYDQIVDNQQMIYNAINLFSEIEQLTREKIPLERREVSAVHALVNDIAGLMVPLGRVRNHRIVISDGKSHFKARSLAIHEIFFKKLMHELLVNAMKYSSFDSSISMLVDTRDDNLEISIMNTPEKSADGIQGIPQEYENIVFEPFFRISRTIQEEYRTLDFGLGLTLAEKIVKNHGGKIAIHNVIDHSDFSKNPGVKVNCTVSLPLAG